MKIYLLLISVFIFNILSAQDSTHSAAFKQNFKRNLYPLIKPKYISYPLMTGYLLQKKAVEGDAFAQHELGLRYLLGKGFQPDTLKAVQLIKKAAEKNIASAKYNYGILFLNGIGVGWNPFVAFENIKFAAESQMPEAQYVMGIFYTDDLIVIRNLSKASIWFNKSASNGFEPAKRALQDITKSGVKYSSSNYLDSVQANTDGLQNEYQIEILNMNLASENKIDSIVNVFDKTKAQEVMKLLGIFNSAFLEDTSNAGLLDFACKQGSPEALLIKGKIEERKNNPVNIINAAQFFIKSFRLGSIQALEQLMSLMKRDNFFRIIKRQIELKNPNAMYIWASLIALGIDFQLTPVQAFQLLQNAANLNHINSLIEIGLCFYNGNLVEQNYQKAILAWDEAVKLGSMEAKVRKAFLQIQSNDNSEIQKQNAAILIEASNNGSVLAQAYLGFCYEKGVGVRQQKSEAERLYRLAAKRGNQAAYNSLKRMYDELRPEAEEFKLY